MLPKYSFLFYPYIFLIQNTSFLVEELIIPWQKREKWFWDMLIDATLANSTLGYEIFNPSKPFIRTPHLAPDSVLEQENAYLGKNYPWSKKKYGYKYENPYSSTV